MHTQPSASRLRVAAHRGEFDVLVVAAIDRLGRSMSANVQAILDLDRLGVEVVSVREPWLSTAGPVRSLLVAIFSWVAEQERLTIISRTKAGMARARREGKHIGRPPVAIDMPLAIRLREEGLSVRATAKRLGVGASTLHRAMQVHDALQARVPEGGGREVAGDPKVSPTNLGVVAA